MKLYKMGMALIGMLSLSCANSKTYNCPDAIAMEVSQATNEYCDVLGECWIKTKDSGMTFLLEKVPGYAGYHTNEAFASEKIYIDPVRTKDHDQLLAIILHELGHAAHVSNEPGGHDDGKYKSVMITVVLNHPLLDHLTCKDRKNYAISHGYQEPDCVLTEVW